MPENCFYIDDPLIDSEVTLSDQEFHHMTKVMRATKGERVQLVNGKGVLADATLLEMDKKRALLHIQNVIREEKPRCHIILAQSIPRINRLDSIIEKATELGVGAIYLFPAALSERKELSEHQLERLRAIAIAAMKQSGRLYLPEIVLKPSLKSLTSLKVPSFFGDVDKNAPHLLTALKGEMSEVLFFVGPESGFREEEEALLKTCAQGVSLHPNILRTDTAAIVALTFLSTRL